MAKRWVQWLGIGITGMAAAVMTGCAAQSSAQGPNVALADSQSALGYKQPTWKRPFWERWTHNGPHEDNAPAGGEAQAEAAPATPAQVQARVDLRSKVGVYIDTQSANAQTLYRLVHALENTAASHDITIVGPDALADAIAQQQACASKANMKCRRALAVYPGVRALLVIGAHPATTDSKAITVKTQMLDTDFGIDYAPRTTIVSTQATGGTNRGPVTTLPVWSDRVLELTANRIAIAPWFTRAFAQKGQDVYLSAGRASGLNKGAVLAVHTKGFAVHAPGGQTVGWDPGPAVGKVKIEQLIGAHMAVATPVSGRIPQPQDRLMVNE